MKDEGGIYANARWERVVIMKQKVRREEKRSVEKRSEEKCRGKNESKRRKKSNQGSKS